MVTVPLLQSSQCQVIWNSADLDDKAHINDAKSSQEG